MSSWPARARRGDARVLGWGVAGSVFVDQQREKEKGQDCNLSYKFVKSHHISTFWEHLTRKSLDTHTHTLAQVATATFF